MTHNEAKKRIESDPDFIYSRRFGFSLDKCLDRYPDGAPTKVIAQALLMTEEEVEESVERVVGLLRDFMKVEVDD